MGTQSTTQDVLRTDHYAVPLASGLTLGARLWRPAGSDQHPVPAIVDYHPYRSSDGSAVADEAIYGALASRGYACVKLDVRGTGNSDGLHLDQFDAAYWTDATEALAWIAAQPWCDGRTGMTGLSWPAHASLMVATDNPPSLGAILPVDGADDRYLNRYQGGCLLTYAVWHGAQLSGMHLRPPLPWVVGDRWRQMWLERLSAHRNYFEIWGAHPTFDAYWHAGSAKRDLGRITCQVLATVGWADTGYAVALPRVLQDCGSAAFIAGPWGHCFPHAAQPGPGFDFVDLATRWFDQTLKGASAVSQPKLTAWMIESHEPRARLTNRPGYWVDENSWPMSSVQTERYGLAPGRLDPDASSEATVSIRSPLTIGATSGEWMPWYPIASGAYLAEDQREADGQSLWFDGEPVAADLEILGQPLLSLSVSSDKSCGQIVVRLCDVAPDGASTRITYGFLNLSHRAGDEQPMPVEPGESYQVEVTLAPIGWCLKAGHRLRVAISTSYFPIIWPAAQHANLTFDMARCNFALPVRKAGTRCASPAPSASSSKTSLSTTTLRAPSVERYRKFDIETSTSTIVVDEDYGEMHLDQDGLTFGSAMKRIFIVEANDPLSARCDTSASWTLGRSEWSTKVTIEASVTSDGATFQVRTRIEAFENGTEIYARDADNVIPRGSA